MPSRLARGMRVGDRYRLEHELGSGSATWEAFDERLDRPVALRTFDQSLDRAEIVKRAGIAASLTHPRVVRVFDTGEDGGRFFTVSEFVGHSLQTVRLPLAADTALQTAIDIAEALAYAHERNVVHGHLHEGNVLLSESGAKVGDFALSGHGHTGTKEDDLRAFGALLRRVTRAPEGAVGTGMSLITDRLVAGSYAVAGEVMRDLLELRPAPEVARQRRPRRGWVVIAIAVLLAVVAFAAMQLGERRPEPEMIPGGRITGTLPLAIAGIDDHDPPPGDRKESSSTVRNAIDNDAATFWSTENYKDSPDFSGIKDGVGLILDLGKSVEVGQAQFVWVVQGCGFELKYSANPQAPVGEWSQAATFTTSPVSAAIEFEAATARYWLLWITSLAPASDGYQCGVKEADLFAPK